jgi:uncharacterized protein
VTAEGDLATLLASLTATARDERYVYVTVSHEDAETIGAAASIVEDEGTTLVIPQAEADALGLHYDYVAGWITLEVYSALSAVGLTAVVSSALADAGISCNILAGFHHDHLLVPEDDLDTALDVLARLAG